MVAPIGNGIFDGVLVNAARNLQPMLREYRILIFATSLLLGIATTVSIIIYSQQFLLFLHR